MPCRALPPLARAAARAHGLHRHWSSRRWRRRSSIVQDAPPGDMAMMGRRYPDRRRQPRWRARSSPSAAAALYTRWMSSPGPRGRQRRSAPGGSHELDLENLAEEIADVSRREADALESHLETLVMHLLKWRHDPDHRSRSREGTIRVARHKAVKLLRDSPSLRPRLPALLEDAYLAARIRAGVETGLPEETFPRRLPFHPRSGHQRLAARGVAGSPTGQPGLPCPERLRHQERVRRGLMANRPR